MDIIVFPCTQLTATSPLSFHRGADFVTRLALKASSVQVMASLRGELNQQISSLIRKLALMTPSSGTKT